MIRIPKFKTLDEAAEFWETHDFEDHVDDTEPVEIAVKMLPRRQKALTVPLDSKMYRQIESMAAQRHVAVADLVSSWVRERVLAESAVP